MASPRFAEQYEALAKMRDVVATMKKNQSLRGKENFDKRMLERSQKNTWRQMKGVQLFMHELAHPHNRPFLYGLVISCSAFMYLYVGARYSDKAKEESKYWQRFHANKH